MLRNSFKYVSYKDIKKFAFDFKAMYKVPTEEIALSELDGIKKAWDKKYPYAINSWETELSVVLSQLVTLYGDRINQYL